MASWWFCLISVVLGLGVGVPGYFIEEENPLEVEVSTSYVIVRWTREGDWDNVTSFMVSLERDEIICNETVDCGAIECEFNSNENVNCTELTPCTEINITVGGSGVNSSIDIITAPAPKGAVKTKIIDTSLVVLWTETSDEPHKECLNTTEVMVTFARTGTVTKSTSSQVDRVLFPLNECDLGAGEVFVTSLGGSGSSEPKKSNFTFEDSALVTPIIGSLELNATCDSIEASWELIDWCPYLAWFRVTLKPSESVTTTPDYNSTSTTFEGLDAGTNYEVCVQPVDSSSDDLAVSICSNIRTKIPAVEDLQLEAINHTAVQVSWSPSDCNMSEPQRYEVEVVTCNNFTNETCTGATFVNSTTELNYTQTGLEPYTQYHVSVVSIYASDSSYQADDYVITLPMAPYDLEAFLQDASTIYVSWNYLDELSGNQTYGISWKLEDSDVIYSGNTTFKEYVIQGYNGTGSTLLCVTVTLDAATSIPECKEFRLYYLEDDFGLILGLMLGIPLIILAIGLALARVFKVTLADVFPGV